MAGDEASRGSDEGNIRCEVQNKFQVNSFYGQRDKHTHVSLDNSCPHTNPTLQVAGKETMVVMG